MHLSVQAEKSIRILFKKLTEEPKILIITALQAEGTEIGIDLSSNSDLRKTG